MASDQSERDASSPPVPAPDRQCERFSSKDGDIAVFRSVDGALFNIHRINLRVVTDGPFAEDFPTSDGEIIDLTEDAETLETLFTFVYSGRHPTLADTPFDRLAKLAEAAEKYGVAPARNICLVRMTLCFKEEPLRTLAYAYKHDYPDLMNACAPLTIGTSTDTAGDILPPLLYIPWTRYDDGWMTTILKSSAIFFTDKAKFTHNKDSCAVRNEILSTIYLALCRRKAALLNELDDIATRLKEIGKNCAAIYREVPRETECQAIARLWVEELQQHIDSRAPFSSFLVRQPAVVQ
ncbi:hypothetical protein FB107DRAFT_279603 [Schizophyllum commune]